MIPLSTKRRSELRAEAHKLSPVVIIGDKGLTDEVIAEIDRSLKAHELIKVRAATDERDARAVWIETICDRLEAHAVQQIGKVFVIYRANPKEEKRKSDPGPLPRARGGRDDDKKRGGRGDDKKRGGRDDEKRASEDGRPPRAPRARGRGNDARSTYAKKPRSGGWSDDSRGASTKRRPRSGGSAVETQDPPKTKRPPRGAALDDALTGVKRTSRPRSRTPSPRPASEPRRRRPRTSR
jgi:RNA-binding protein